MGEREGEEKGGIDRVLGFDEDSDINTVGCRKRDGWEKKEESRGRR